MTAQVITAVLILPFAAAFIYAGVHEYLRYKSDGRATYGLVYDEDTGTTHVTGIPEDEEAFDPDDFDPSNYRDLELRTSDEEGTDEDEADGRKAEDESEDDRRTARA
ncbi:hypothetical protein [Pseudooceanicola atlanticus]|uniref:hypothetical protein n=1 Tax=Pseudooceanicola atlanticus TaxID=1461694 RepID=UPI0006941D48|nr:hypothetical protein [Pseudooceanicola atlanticus]